MAPPGAAAALAACNRKMSARESPNKPAPPTRKNSRRENPSQVLPLTPGIDNINAPCSWLLTVEQKRRTIQQRPRHVLRCFHARLPAREGRHLQFLFRGRTAENEIVELFDYLLIVLLAFYQFLDRIVRSAHC